MSMPGNPPPHWTALHWNALHWSAATERLV